jgi:Zn-dependent M16 (insulinase) family peptidase
MRNFLVTKELELGELQSKLTELVHEPTGAKIMHIGNEDPENLFCLSFQTIPESSNGVAHILEHTVLCGSKRFPVRDPFFSMTRRSLHTFMNAFTGHDFTSYPASSQIEKDFYNLLDVYLDAVFHPLLKKTSFEQEGHRLEYVGGKLTIQGIVYNEMKGAMSSPDSRLWQEIAKRLMPDLTYAHNSGGDPKEIPRLTYDDLLEFHRLFYHPSRCLFFFYGNLPLQKHLEFIEKRALLGVEKLETLPPLKLQTRFKEPIIATATYPGKGQAIIAFSWLTAPRIHASDILALSLLESVLLETDASPLSKALLQSGLCTDVESSLDTEMSEVPFIIRCSGCKPENREKLQRLLFEVLEKPLDPALIESALHQLELERTEISPDGGPFGLTLFFRAALIKQHGIEPEGNLLIHSLFRELRDRLQDPEYLPSILRKYLVNNPHLVIQTLVSDPSLEKKENEGEKERLIRMEKELTATQKKEIAEKKTEAAEESIECLPKLGLESIPPKVKDYPLEQKKNLYTHTCFTNQMIYADYVFDLPPIEAEDLPLLSLLSELWTELGCGGRDYERTLHEMQAYTGGIDAFLSLHVDAKDPKKMSPTWTIRGKALKRHAKPFFSLLLDFAKGVDFSDEKRIREWLQSQATELEQSLADHSAQYASSLAFSGLSQAGFISDQWNGLPYYRLVQKKSLNRLQELADHLCRGKPDLIISSDSDFDAKALLNYQNGRAKKWDNVFSLPKVPSQVRIIPAAVAFTSRGIKTVHHSSDLMLAAKLMKSVVLHPEIREKGGAYGGGASYAGLTGHFNLYAYRDPHLSRTLEVFEQAIQTIADGKFSDRDLEEAKISLIGEMDAPVAPSGRAAIAYARKRAHRTRTDRQKLRAEILAATKKSIATAVTKHLLHAKATTVSLLGEEIWKKEQKNVDLKFYPEL